MGVQDENPSNAGFPETVTTGHWGNGRNSGGSGVESDNVRPKQVQNEDHSKDSLGVGGERPTNQSGTILATRSPSPSFFSSRTKVSL